MNNNTEQQLKPCQDIIDAFEHNWIEHENFHLRTPRLSEAIDLLKVAMNTRTPDPFKAQLLEWLEAFKKEAQFEDLGGVFVATRVIEYVQTH